MVVEIGVSSIVLRLLTANKGVLSEGFVIFAPINCNFPKPQIRNYAPNMIQKRKESASLVKRGHSASNVTIKTYKCPLPHHAT